jgi:fructose-specific phosphotransferase system IIC component
MVLVIVAVSAWIFALIFIYDSKIPFSQQAPKCMFSTMFIFGLLIGAFKIIEKIEGDESKNEKEE